MMYPRLRLARNLLTDDGVIFISIGQAEIDNVLKLCNELYGEDNHVGTISRMMKSGGNKGQYFSPNMEYILVYAKNINCLGYFREPLSDDIIKTYNHVETEGERKGESYTIKGLCQPGLGIRPNQRYWIEAPDGTFLIPQGKNFPEIIADGEKILPTDEDTCWKWTPERYFEEKAKGNILFSKNSSATALVDETGAVAKWNVFNKIWLSDREEEGRVPVDLITKWENRISSTELKDMEIPFDFAKPVNLIKYLVDIVEDTQDSIVLDFFSGSATTAHAVMQLNAEDGGNRKFICVQLPEPCDEKSEAFKAGYKNICEIGKERIRRAGDKIVKESGNKDLDIGFKVFKLDSSNLEKWDPDYDDLEQTLLVSQDNIKEGRTQEDLIYEIMLKYGIDLTLPIEKYESGNTIYSIGFGALLVCLDNKITKDITDSIIELASEDVSRVVFKDNGFASDADKTNIKETLRTHNIDEFITI